MSKLYVIEGHDGAGKSSVVTELQLRLCADSKFMFTREPFSLDYINLIKHCKDPIEKALLFAADRAHHMRCIEQTFIEAGHDNFITFMDRYVLSNLVYQSLELYDEMSSQDSVEYIHAIQSKSIIKPRITFILECDVGVAVERCKNKRDTLDSVSESYATIDSIKKRYHTLEPFYKWNYGGLIYYIDTTHKSVAEVANEIMSHIV